MVPETDLKGGREDAPIDQTVVGQELILMGKKETAKNLLAMGKLTPKEIAQITGLTLKELKSLKKSGKR